MVIKSFEIDFNGKKETIEYENELTFGETEDIVNRSVDMSDINKPKIKLADFRMMILAKTLKKAPFPIDNIAHIRNQKSKVINDVLEHIMEDLPLADFLGDWMTSFVGSQVVSDLPLEPMPIVPLDSDGQSDKQTSMTQNS